MKLSVILGAALVLYAGQAASPAPAAGGEHAVVSPDGSRVAFTAGRDLFVIGTDGSGRRQLTHSPDTETAAVWTTTLGILFSTYANDTSRLYAIDPDGQHQRLLTSVPGRAPMLSPDGTRVLYATGSWTSTRLMIAKPDGSGAHAITDGSSIAWNCQWSPDGTSIAYTGRDDGGVLHVFVMKADGTGSRQVTHLSKEDGQAQVPAWSPDGHELALQTTDAKGRPGFVWIADASTGAARKLAAHDAPYADEVPSWFPDGRRLAFQSNRTGRMEIWMMNRDGSGQFQITR